MTRRHLPNKRASENFTMEFQGERYHVTVGYYGDTRTGEVFINRIRDKNAARMGQALDATCRDAAIMMSMALQHGANLLDLEHSVTRDEELAPMSIIGAVIDIMGQNSRARAPESNMESASGQEGKESQEGGEVCRQEGEEVANA